MSERLLITFSEKYRFIRICFVKGRRVEIGQSRLVLATQAAISCPRIIESVEREHVIDPRHLK
jgi:hypothetical protein